MTFADPPGKITRGISDPCGGIDNDVNTPYLLFHSFILALFKRHVNYTQVQLISF